MTVSQPIPLDLLTLVNFTDPPTQRGAGLLRNLRGERHVEGSTNQVTPDSASDSRSVYPCTIHHNGRMGGPYILYAESAQARTEWHTKLEEALGIRKVVQESNKVFEVETLSVDTFFVPAMAVGTTTSPAWSQDTTFTGKVTCSVPFSVYIYFLVSSVMLIPYRHCRRSWTSCNRLRGGRVDWVSSRPQMSVSP